MHPPPKSATDDQVRSIDVKLATKRLILLKKQKIINIKTV